ncbi:hypothetical protein T01_10440 [Trichinella spiralis]|uniref:Reverse transcriptase Ty1/copia-type domain-containing protein n=1 Tax=Trichinella spiralis TaxID=6334 RepID=A0A0V1AWM0_TRISP|nr:hypothetical protein T01_10440 [Trichinella spiralis]
MNGFEDPNNKDMVWHLKRSIYGLEQSARAWNTKATEILTAIDTEHQLSQPGRYEMKSMLAVGIQLQVLEKSEDEQFFSIWKKKRKPKDTKELLEWKL